MTPVPDRLARLERELRGIFGGRLQALVAYQLRGAAPPGASRSHDAHATPAPTHTLAIVESLTLGDLKACAEATDAWQGAGLATPLVLPAGEFERSLDAFPFEFGAIVADHVMIAGRDPFVGLSVDPADLRRACEMQARGHLLHLREGFLETRGRGDAVAVLVVRSAAPFAALVASVARLQGVDGHDPEAAARHAERVLSVEPGRLTGIVRLQHVTEMPATDALRTFPAYLDAVERLVRYVDQWREP